MFPQEVVKQRDAAVLAAVEALQEASAAERLLKCLRYVNIDTIILHKANLYVNSVFLAFFIVDTRNKSSPVSENTFLLYFL